MQETRQCRVCAQTFAVVNIRRSGGFQHCPLCGTPIELDLVVRKPNDVKRTDYDAVMLTWPDGAQGEALRRLQHEGALIVVKLPDECGYGVVWLKDEGWHDTISGDVRNTGAA